MTVQNEVSRGQQLANVKMAKEQIQTSEQIIPISYSVIQAVPPPPGGGGGGGEKRKKKKKKEIEGKKPCCHNNTAETKQLCCL